MRNHSGCRAPYYRSKVQMLKGNSPTVFSQEVKEYMTHSCMKRIQRWLNLLYKGGEAKRCFEMRWLMSKARLECTFVKNPFFNVYPRTME